MGDRANGRGVKPKGTILRRTRGGHVKRVRNQGYHWTEESEVVFLDALASTNNVLGAAAVTGFSKVAIYKQRRARPDFAARWDAALAQGIARLDMALVRAAADSMEGVPVSRRSPIPKMTAAEALATAKHLASRPGQGGHRPTAVPRRRTFEDVKGGIVVKIETLRAARALPVAPATSATGATGAE